MKTAEIKNISLVFLRYLALVFLGFNLWAIYKIFYPLTVYPVFGFFKIFGGASLVGDVLDIGVKVEFINACIAASAYFLLLILILSSWEGYEKGMKVFLTGAFLILMANVIRIIILLLILKYSGQNLFETVHLFFWRIIASVYVAGVWVWIVSRFKVGRVPFYSDFITIRKVCRERFL